MPLRIVLKPFIPVVLEARAEAEQAGMHTTSEAIISWAAELLPLEVLVVASFL